MRSAQFILRFSTATNYHVAGRWDRACKGRVLAGVIPCAFDKAGTGGVIAFDSPFACIFTRSSDETSIRVNALVSALARDRFKDGGPDNCVGSWQVAPAGDEEKDGGGGEAVDGAAHG